MRELIPILKEIDLLSACLGTEWVELQILLISLKVRSEVWRATCRNDAYLLLGLRSEGKTLKRKERKKKTKIIKSVGKIQRKRQPSHILWFSSDCVLLRILNTGFNQGACSNIHSIVSILNKVWFKKVNFFQHTSLNPNLTIFTHCNFFKAIFKSRQSSGNRIRLYTLCLFIDYIFKIWFMLFWGFKQKHTCLHMPIL